MQTLAWRQPGEARRVGERALEINDSLRNQVEIVKIRAATAVALANLGDPGGADAEIEHGLTLAGDCGYPGGLAWCWVARTLAQIRRSDPTASRQSAARVAAKVDDLQGNRFWGEIVTWWTDPAAGRSPDGTTQWLGATTPRGPGG